MKLYLQLKDDGVPKRQPIREIFNLLGGQYSVQRINAWVKRYKSESTQETQHNEE